MKKTNNKGFSLVELIIVIAIMAILVGILAPQFIKYVENSRESTDIQNIESVKVSAEACLADGTFPLGTAGTITIATSAAGNSTVVSSLAAWDVADLAVDTTQVEMNSAASVANDSIINITASGAVTVAYAANLNGNEN